MQRERMDVTLLPNATPRILGESWQRFAICPFLPLTQHKIHSKAASATLEEGDIAQGLARLKLESLQSKDARAEHYFRSSTALVFLCAAIAKGSVARANYLLEQPWDG